MAYETDDADGCRRGFKIESINLMENISFLLKQILGNEPFLVSLAGVCYYNKTHKSITV